MIAAKVIEDCVSPHGIRLRSVQWRGHRSILAEVNTHGLLAKNARSSRAVPTHKLIEEVMTDPALPVRWTKNCPGMVGYEDLGPVEAEKARDIFLRARDHAVASAQNLVAIGAHKQHVNRLLEPFMWVDGVMTATQWKNFFALRIHPAAQPEFNALAIAIKEAFATSSPRWVDIGGWHTPYVTEAERKTQSLEVRQKLSARRVARVSYKPFDGAGDVISECQRADEMLAARPLHASPFAQIATPDWRRRNGHWANPKLHAQFEGWCQWRQMLPEHYVEG